jgi:hypothetical protein
MDGVFSLRRTLFHHKQEAAQIPNEQLFYFVRRHNHPSHFGSPIGILAFARIPPQYDLRLIEIPLHRRIRFVNKEN